MAKVILVVVDSANDVRTKRAYYRNNGFTLGRTRIFDEAEADLQDVGRGIIPIGKKCAVFTAVK